MTLIPFTTSRPWPAATKCSILYKREMNLMTREQILLEYLWSEACVGEAAGTPGFSLQPSGAFGVQSRRGAGQWVPVAGPSALCPCVIWEVKRHPPMSPT